MKNKEGKQSKPKKNYLKKTKKAFQLVVFGKKRENMKVSKQRDSTSY